MLNVVSHRVKESVWTGFDTYGSSLQPAVFGDINSLSVRGVDLHFVRKRERYSAEEGLSHGKTHKGVGSC